MEIPKSISSLVYELPKNRRWVWSLSVWVVALTLMPLMLDASAGSSWRELVAFLTCGLGVGVGCVPLMKGERNTGHYVLAAIVGVLSQVWVVLSGDSTLQGVFVAAWCCYGMLFIFFWKWWCLVAEIVCLATVVVSLVV